MKSAWRNVLFGLALTVSRIGSRADDDSALVGKDGSGGAVPAIVPAPKGQSAYARIISTRNGFGLLEPTPPATPPVVDPNPPPPPTPPSTVQLTGFSRWGGEKKVYMIVTKQGAKSPSYIDLREGEESFDIKALQIDDQNETAKILNTGIEQTLNFKDNGVKPTPGAPGGAPGVNPPNAAPGVPPPPVVAPSRYANSGPTVVGRGGIVNNMAATQAPTAPMAPTTFTLDGNPIPNNYGQNNGGQNVGNTFGNVITPTPNQNLNPQNPSGTPRRVFNIPPPPLPPVP